MPFDDKQYDGIFCYALIHLLDSPERIKLIQDCYHQLKPGGTMMFVTISKEDPIFGKGTPLGTDRFERMQGVQIFFYDVDSVKREFGGYGLEELSNIDEPGTHANDQPPQKFLMVTCKK